MDLIIRDVKFWIWWRNLDQQPGQSLKFATPIFISIAATNQEDNRSIPLNRFFFLSNFHFQRLFNHLFPSPLVCARRMAHWIIYQKQWNPFKFFLYLKERMEELQEKKSSKSPSSSGDSQKPSFLAFHWGGRGVGEAVAERGKKVC